MSESTPLFDAAEYLDSPEAVEAYLADAKADADPSELEQAEAIVQRICTEGKWETK